MTAWLLETEESMSDKLIKFVWSHRLGDLEVWSNTKEDALKVIEQYLGFAPLMHDIKEVGPSPQDISPIDERV